MATSRRPLRIFVSLSAVIIALTVVGFLAFSKLEKNLVYYWTPTDLLAKKDQALNMNVRLGGMVQKGSLVWDKAALTLRFVMAENPEGKGPSVLVVAQGAPPQMFREGVGCIVEGSFDGAIFRATRLLVKHSNEYRPPTPDQDPRGLYTTVVPEKPLTHPESAAPKAVEGAVQ